MPRPDVCVIGEINPDLILYGLPPELKPEQETLVEGFRLTLGSSSAIFAHNISALGTSTGMISKIGSDALGRMALQWLSAGGVDVTRVSTTSNGTPTGITVVLAHPGHRFILTYPGTMFDLAYADIDFEYLFSARHLHLSSYFLHRALRPHIADIFRQAKSKGLSTSLDTNDDPEDKWGEDLAAVLPFVDIFFPNEREAKKIAGTADLPSALAKLSQLCRLVVVKRGAEGAVAREGSREWRAASVPVHMVDPVGAGDSFDAGYIHKFLQGANREECLAFAGATGAFSITCAGGIEAFRDRAKLAEFLRLHRPSPGN